MAHHILHLQPSQDPILSVKYKKVDFFFSSDFVKCIVLEFERENWFGISETESDWFQLSLYTLLSKSESQTNNSLTLNGYLQIKQTESVARAT